MAHHSLARGHIGTAQLSQLLHKGLVLAHLAGIEIDLLQAPLVQFTGALLQHRTVQTASPEQHVARSTVGHQRQAGGTAGLQGSGDQRDRIGSRWHQQRLRISADSAE